RLLVITGAGLSADSGLPTYRGIGGLYETDDTEDRVPIEVALSGAMLEARPELCWKHIAQIERGCRGAVPNAAHHALVRLQQRFESLTVLTQNIDGFHADAGTHDLIEIHGTVRDLVCTGCGAQQRVRSYEGMTIPPACVSCSALVRPRVVLFGEMLPEAALARLQEVLEAGVDAVVSVGTTSGFPYIAAPVLDAARRGLPTIEINPGETGVSRVVRWRLRERAAVALPALEQRLLQSSS
ncbi:MAG TPA: Sir2 family NAD-dependent protein deacetylase, partial [Candidatus Binatia bacterium]|nr:Sir2 family NAD-dependent protein deacetylase [Candidatus Binatia bacterium]